MNIETWAECDQIKIEFRSKNGGSERFWVTPLDGGRAEVDNDLITAPLVQGDVVTYKNGRVTGVVSRSDRLQIQAGLYGAHRRRVDEQVFLQTLQEVLSDWLIYLDSAFDQLWGHIDNEFYDISELDQLISEALEVVLDLVGEGVIRRLRHMELRVHVLSCPCSPLDLKFHMCDTHPGVGFEFKSILPDATNHVPTV